MLLNGQAITGQENCFASACIDKNTSELIIKIVNVGSGDKQKTITIESKGKGQLTPVAGHAYTCTYLLRWGRSRTIRTCHLQ